MSGIQPLAGTSVRVRVPASSANLGPGFDSVGLALGVFDEVLATVSDRQGVRVAVRGSGADQLPTDESHLVASTMLATWRLLDTPAPVGLDLECVNEIPQSRGMGSSATAIVAGIVAAQALADTSAEIDLAVTNRIAAAMEGHPDNSSASVYGGATLSWMGEGMPWREATRVEDLPPVRTLPIELSDSLEPVMIVPAAQLATATARAALPAVIGHAEAAANSARAAALVWALGNDPSVLFEATTDFIHQEQRRGAYPESMALVDRLRELGHPAVISGAGPSVLVLATTHSAAQIAQETGPGWQVLQPGVSPNGALCTTVVH